MTTATLNSFSSLTEALEILNNIKDDSEIKAALKQVSDLLPHSALMDANSSNVYTYCRSIGAALSHHFCSPDLEISVLAKEGLRKVGTIISGFSQEPLPENDDAEMYSLLKEVEARFAFQVSIENDAEGANVKIDITNIFANVAGYEPTEPHTFQLVQEYAHNTDVHIIDTVRMKTQPSATLATKIIGNKETLSSQFVDVAVKDSAGQAYPGRLIKRGLDDCNFHFVF